MIDEETKEEHPSFGTIRVSRVQGHARLFQCSVDTGQSIRITISTAQRNRNLARDWVFSGKELIEVEMSCNQFAEMITHLNCGDGTPCTLKHINRNRIPEPPQHHIREKYVEEFDSCMKDVHEACNAVADLEAVLDASKVSKAYRAKIVHLFESMSRKIWDSVPFIHSQFNEKMGHVVTEAKAEVEAFVESKIRSLGIDALESEIAKGLAAPSKSQVFLEDMRDE